MNIFKGGDGLSKVLGFLLDFPHFSRGDNSEADIGILHRGEGDLDSGKETH